MKMLSLTLAAMFTIAAFASTANAQKSKGDNGRPRTVSQTISAVTTTNSEHLGATGASVSDESAIQSQINSVYLSFQSSYRLGPGDVIAIYVDKHPEDTLAKAIVSPVGQVYYPLMGNVTVVGKTLPQLQTYFTTSISEFIKEPRVTVALLEVNSAKIGVLGEVRTPGVIIMNRPMRVLDAITASGGITDLGNASSVSILRQYEDGRVEMVTSNVKKILKGKADPEENAYLRAGDTIIVHGNLYKKIGKISGLVGVTSFITFLTSGGR
ncbi:MAG TPA: polysaccharide biosynthesis/export family protein [Blastocatellia bacterium]|nr:polysaccharide biosynthesis/export family protein [Blastocatellia bacterium]